MKFEIQTGNFVWAIKNKGPPKPRLLPRKFAPTSAGLDEGQGEERGDRPAYLSVGRKGGPARKKGSILLVEARGVLRTEDATATVDTSKTPQVVREYRFKTAVTEAGLIGKRVKAGQLELIDEVDHALDPAAAGTFNPHTFELKYSRSDGTPLDVHLDEEGIFRKGHLQFVKVRRAPPPGIDFAKAAQHVEIWKVTKDPAGKVEFNGDLARVELVSATDNARVKSMKGLYNPYTWERRYFDASAFSGKTLSSAATPLEVHMDQDGRLRTGTIKLLVQGKVAEDKEQTAIEVQSEHGGFIELETPKWFREWSDLKERLQEAVDITQAMNDERGTAREVTDAAILSEMQKEKDKASAGPVGKVVEWPAGYSTSHLKNLGVFGRRLVVEIVDESWWARLQASEAIELSKYGSLMDEHEQQWVKDIVVPAASSIFTTAFTAAKAKAPSLNEHLFADLKGFLLLVTSYIARGQVLDMKGTVAKATFRLMSRTNFGSMFKELLSPAEQALFVAMLGDRKKANDNPILSVLEGPINAQRAAIGLGSVTLTRSTRFFFNSVGTTAPTHGPRIYDWLVDITKGKDDLSGPGISDAMGVRKVETRSGDKAYYRARFEVRGTSAHGGNDRPAGDWVAFAKEMFESAMRRSIDTPDDPRTPRLDESSKTGLKK